jgi:hypothetical protein
MEMIVIYHVRSVVRELLTFTISIEEEWVGLKRKIPLRTLWGCVDHVMSNMEIKLNI